MGDVWRERGGRRVGQEILDLTGKEIKVRKAKVVDLVSGGLRESGVGIYIQRKIVANSFPLRASHLERRSLQFHSPFSRPPPPNPTHPLFTIAFPLQYSSISSFPLRISLMMVQGLSGFPNYTHRSSVRRKMRKRRPKLCGGERRITIFVCAHNCLAI